RGPTSRARASSATAPHLPDADRPAHTTSDGQTRDLPGSDAIPLHVMWPSTPAGRQHLAWRCRTCCLRANKDSRPLRYLIFRGSIPHPMQSLCTLRDHCRQWPRNTRYQADATPYLGRTFTGWIAPACGWRTYSITSSARVTSVGGTARPSILAVTWLMTSSNLLACTTGRSAGLAPLRMRPV